MSGHLVAETKTFRCGYGPRAVNLSRDHKNLFVGCKDGSITIVDLAAAQEKHLHRTGNGVGHGVRFLFDAARIDPQAEGWLLVGDNSGRLELCHWQGGPGAEVEWRAVLGSEPLQGQEKSGPVILIDVWDEENGILLVSWRNRNAELYEASWTSTGLSLCPVQELCGVHGVYAQVKSPSGRLLIGETAALWHVEGEQVSPLEQCWQDLDRPGFVSDATIVAGAPVTVYLSTDDGVYLLTWRKGTANLDKVHLPGLSGLCMAVSNASMGDFSYLWVSDLVGDVYMFRKPRKSINRHWQQYGFRFESSQVMLSIAAPAADGTLALCQACRNEQTVISWYRPRKAGILAELEQSSAADVLRWASLDQFKEWWTARPENWAGWCLEARFAFCIEEAGAEPHGFTEFLASPNPERLAGEILKEIGGIEGARRALILWTDTLLGTVHRRLKNRREQQCLAVIRWLRKLGEALAASDGDWRSSVSRVIEACIEHSRRWGVFGGTYSQRREFSSPLAALEEDPAGDRRLDSIAYNSLLFARRVNVEAEAANSFPSIARIPWDVRSLEMDGPQGALIAVSWGRGGIDLFRAEKQENRVNPSLVRVGSLGSSEPEEHRRSVVLAKTPEGKRFFLLEAPSRVAGAPEGDESLTLSILDTNVQLLQQSSCTIPFEESAYCFLELASLYVLVGLKGREGKAPLGVISLDPAGAIHWLPFRADQEKEQDFFEFQPAYPELTSIKLNPVWALAGDSAQWDKDRKEFEVVAGCGDGQIWKLTVKIAADGLSWSIPSENKKLPSQERPVSVGRLGSPVRALAMHGRTKSRPKRVFAGGSDGTIIAYQEIPRAGSETYATLWSTREDGTVARLHLIASRLESAPGSEEVSLLIAVTQKGTAILFSNRPEVEEQLGTTEEWKEDLHRPQVPGERLGRFNLESPVFASALIDGFGPSSLKGIARLAIATGEGKLLLVTLHVPKYTDLRQAHYVEIRDSWLKSLREPGGSRQVLGQLVRRAEAMYAAAPRLSAILVRWILHPEDPAATTLKTLQQVDFRPGRQWIPRHLQPLVNLDKAWGILCRRKPTGPKKKRLETELRKSLLESFRSAREVDDVTLFKEIIEVTLNRANHHLFQQARDGTLAGKLSSPDDDSGLMDWYLEVLNCFIEMKGAWLGSERGLDTKIRVVIVKNLVDGDTLWSLSEALKRRDRDERYVRTIIDKRSEQIHNFLATGDPLLSLEILRATNLSMTRACRRLRQEEELEWGAIEGYYEAVGDFASRAVHSTRSELGEALAHEIYRTYALGMLACPSHTLRLTHRMSEADLPMEFGPKILDQFGLMGYFLTRRMPGKTADVFRIGSGIAMQEAKPSSQEILMTVGANRTWAYDEKKVGADNLVLIDKGSLFDRIVDWLYSLANQLSIGDASVNLGQTQRFVQECETRKQAGIERDPFRHSVLFWSEALSDLSRRMTRAGISLVRQDSIRPELVLFSATLTSWCQEYRGRLNEMKESYQIFYPQRDLYDAPLLAVETAAAGFREGAALQKNVVVGVLSHGLLEMLDEHLLELWEIAQALDPRQTWNGEGVPVKGRAGEFARHVLQSTRDAETIPKNLRDLQSFLYGRQAGPSEPVLLEKLVKEFAKAQGWTVKRAFTGVRRDDARVYRFLWMVLAELAKNDKIYGMPVEGFPQVVCTLRQRMPDSEGRAQQPLARIQIRCRYPKEKLDRLLEVAGKGLQAPVAADSSRGARSHGTGLYLANLATAAVGWKLRMKVSKKMPERLFFVLQEVLDESALATGRH